MKKTIWLLCLVLLSSCSRLDTINERLDRLEAETEDIRTALNNLKKAFDEAKIISNFEPFSEPSATGWILTFTDNTSIRLTNGKDGNDGSNGQDGRNGNDGQDGKDGVSPFLRIDQDGFWTVSYDNGLSFSRLQDSSGNPLPARGEAGICVRVTTDESGHYLFELYHPSAPGVVIDRYVTPLDSNPAHIISSISEDALSHIITLTMQDGSSYQFNIQYELPQSIGMLTNKVVLGAGMTVSFEFRVNPSNAVFNYDVTSEACQIALDRTGLATRAGGYITTPTHYRLTKVEQTYDNNGVLKEGQYRAYISDTGISDTYDDLMALVLTLDNGSGKTIQVSSSAIEIQYSHTLLSSFAFRAADNPSVLQDCTAVIEQDEITVMSPFILDATSLIPEFTTTGQTVSVNGLDQASGVSAQDFSLPVIYTVTAPDGTQRNYKVTVKYSGLPIVFIDTPEGAAIQSKETWMENVNIRIINLDGTENYSSDQLQIRGRGNTTWAFPKKPYALKLKSKASILGMPSHKRWVLLANWLDRTLLRNDTAFEISRQSGLAWSVRGKYVEVVLNGKHIGNYYLCEQIKIDENRVNIKSMKATDIEGEAVTGGYLMELDVAYDEVNKFRSSYLNLPYMFKEPDEDVLQPEQLAYMENYINEMESALYAEDWLDGRAYAGFMDLASFADWWLVNELTCIWEPNHPKSCYMYKDRSGRLTAGPVWDFDYFTFIPGTAERLWIKNALYYGRLFQDPVFVTLVKDRWQTLKPLFVTVSDHIRQQAAAIRFSNEMNTLQWPINDTINGDVDLPYDEAVTRIITAFETKLAYLDAQITAM